MKRLLSVFFVLISASSLFGKVVVVGAGLSGLTAAYRLQQKGFDVDVYEARNRVGGRVFSVNVHGATVELGAQNIADGGEALNLRRLTQELGLEIEELIRRGKFFYVDGNEITDIRPLIRAKNYQAEELRQHLTELRIQKSNMKEVLEALFDNEDILFKACATLLTAYEGWPLYKLSTFYSKTLYYQLLGGLAEAHQGGIEDSISFEIAYIKDGNGHLAEKLATHLNVHVNHILTSLTKSVDGRYTLTFKNGQQIKLITSF